MEKTSKYPSEMIDLPSKGILYPEDSSLRSGQVELKYMTAKEEDILTNQNYIKNGTVIDKLLKSLIVDSTVVYGDLLTGDKNAILIAARILGYGSEYSFTYNGQEESVDLSKLVNNELHKDIVDAKENRFEYVLPHSKTKIEYRLLTHRVEQEVEAELKGLAKIHKNNSPTLSTRLKYIVLSVNGDETKKQVRSFVDNEFLARDSRAFRKHLKEFQPDINMMFHPEDGPEGGVEIPIGVTFLWPDAGV